MFSFSFLGNYTQYKVHDRKYLKYVPIESDPTLPLSLSVTAKVAVLPSYLCICFNSPSAGRKEISTGRENNAHTVIFTIQQQ